MKKYFTLLLIASFVFMSSDMPYYGEYKPILMQRSDLEKSIKSIDPIPLMDPGKIYLKGDYIYIIEKYEGIHLINNIDATNPVKEGFITVPGIVDIAIKGDFMYVDNAVDLVSVDISNHATPLEVKRIKNVFPELEHPEWNYLPSEYARRNRPVNTVIVAWKKNEY